MNKKRLSLGLATLFLIVVTSLYYMVPSFANQVNTAAGILAQADIKGMRIYLKGFGLWAPLVSMALMVFQALAAPLPAFVITFANAWIFGWVEGAIISWSGAMIGAALCYWIAQAFGRVAVEKIVGIKGIEKTDKFFAKYGRHSVLIARLLPVVPFDIVSYAAGLTNMSFRTFFWTTGLGQLPATIVYSWLGENMSPSAKYIFWALTGFLSLMVLSLAIKRHIDNKLEQSEHA